MLEKKLNLQIVCEVSDGLEAVHKAAELQPDLILLDVGLPSLNGLEAARRICELSPKSKILFVSQELSFDVVQEAFRRGALGYVAKTHAGIELMAAVEAVRQGGWFASSVLSGHVAELACMRAPNLLYADEILASHSRPKEMKRAELIQ
jgi:DNA-binding NarL/FixJ family response regulator